MNPGTAANAAGPSAVAHLATAAPVLNVSGLTIAVRGGSFHFVLNQPQVPEQSTRAFDATIAPDGSFVSRDGPTFIRGTVKAGHMQGAIAGDACGYDFEADRTGTF
ncbi:MAG: hypothetical protein J0H99_16745 [Rhodospirillales bacterium]|nr:hypothetical protein [Rhodospirillales bacterium]